MRFWSVVARVETDRGRVWVKENAPSQAFEAALVPLVDHLVPDAVATPLAVDRHRGWLATADLGLPMWHDEQVPPLADWVAVLQGYGAVQHVLADHADAVLATGVPTFPEQPDDVAEWVEHLVEASRALPDADPRRLDDAEAAAVADGMPRLRDAAERLAASGIPPSVQHNDLHLGNAFRRPNGSIAFIDLGDALWTHPLTSARIPLWILRNRLELDPEGLGAAARRRRLPRAVDRPLGPRHPARPARRRRPHLVPAPGRVVAAAAGRRARRAGRRAVPALGARVAGRRRGPGSVRLRRLPLSPIPMFSPEPTTFTFAPEMLSRAGEGSGIGREG